MEVLLIVTLLVISIILIVKGGDYFVDAASWIAEVSGIPKLIVGATIVSIATTLPEMLVSVFAATEGKVDISVGNAVGSVTANIGLIMAISIIFIPSVIKRKDYLMKFILMILAAAIIVVCGFFGEVNIYLSIVLLAAFVVFIFENVRSALKTKKEESATNAEEETKIKPTGKVIVTNIIKFVLGVAGIVGGAQLLVDNASALARLMHVSERIIGITIVAVGTSLPELVTTVTAIVKKQSSLSVGNILGANILDLTLIMPLASIISGKSLPISSSSAMIDLPAALVLVLVATIPTIITGKFKRWQGILLMVLYVIYLVLSCSGIFA